jgi:hypothetical protein
MKYKGYIGKEEYEVFEVDPQRPNLGLANFKGAKIVMTFDKIERVKKC